VTPAPLVVTSADPLEAGRCAVCGAAEPLDLVVCPRCAGGAPEVADTLVVVRGDERAYARVPGVLAPAVVGRLAREGRTARAVPVTRAWAALPPRTWALLLAVVVAGAAARFAIPALWWITPLVAVLLLVAAERAMLRPQLDPGVVGSELPPRLQRQVVGAFAELPPGRARDLLADVVRRARALLAAAGAEPNDGRVARDVADLVGACCEIALEHARLDAVLGERGTPSAGAGGAPRDTAPGRAAAARDLLAERLRAAAAAVGELYAQQVERGGPAAERVAELASQLAGEAAARRHGAAEVERLLQSR